MGVERRGVKWGGGGDISSMLQVATVNGVIFDTISVKVR